MVKEYKKSIAFSFVHAMFRFCGSCLHFARLYLKQQTTKVSDNLHFGLPRTFLYRWYVLQEWLAPFQRNFFSDLQNSALKSFVHENGCTLSVSHFVWKDSVTL